MPYVGIGIQQHGSSLVSERMVKAYISLMGAIIICFIIGIMGKIHKEKLFPLPRQQTHNDVEEEISRVLQNSIRGENIKENLRLLTKEPHQAGTKANEKVAKVIESLYKKAGLQKVHTTTYDVLLSYPDWDRPNTISINNRFNKSIFTSKGVSPVILPEEQGAPHAGNQWLAYSAPGNVQADVVYCNFGLPKDFENIRKLGIDMKGKIAMMRYGEGFRGGKVAEAQKNGAYAAILFSDPAEVARGDKDDVYPRSIWMPPEGVQRGSIMKLNGDPLTPLYPAKPGVYKSRTIEEAKELGVLPSIPAIPISYETAYEILSRMDGRPVPLQWQGNINVTYRMGPGLRNNEKVTVNVQSSLENKHIHNVIGYIPGIDEEDRYVILGNHYDAWVYGSIDPNSGTAILAELARAMTETMKNTTWKPSRTIMFAAWDAEEYGLIGSTEFVEEFVTQLSGRVIAYLNMDCFQGNSSLHVNTVPTLKDIVIETAKKVPNPIEEQVYLGRKTLYDTWIRTFPGDNNMPNIPIPGGGSDQGSFLTFGGIPVVDFNFKNTTTRDTYPLYHSLYETPYVNEHLYDTENFAVHRAIGQYWGELARAIADTPVIPINISRLANEINDQYVVDLKKDIYDLPSSSNLIDAKQQISMLEKAAFKFVNVARSFSEHLETVSENLQYNPFDQRELRGVNERLIMAERCFVNPRGAPGAPENRHVLYSISEKDSYTGKVLSAVYDAIDDYKESSDKKKEGRILAEQIAVLYHSIQCSSSTLRYFL